MNPRKRVSRVKSKRARERIYRLQIGGVRYDSHSPRPSSPQHWVKQRWISPIYAGITSKPVKTPRKFVRDVDLWNPRNRVLKIKSKSKESCMYIYINVGIRSILVDIWSTDEIERSNSISYNLTQQDFKPKTQCLNLIEFIKDLFERRVEKRLLIIGKIAMDESRARERVREIEKWEKWTVRLSRCVTVYVYL